MTLETSRVENPIASASSDIRRIVHELITQDLKGAFPKNYSYGAGDSNLVSINTGVNSKNSSELVILTPTGEFRQGLVKLVLLSDRSYWDFDTSQSAGLITPASDFNVVKYAPGLVGSLFNAIANELPVQTDLATVRTTVGVLERGPLLTYRLKQISVNALKEMGEDNPQVKVELEKVDLPKLTAALELAERRKGLVAEVEELAKGMRGRLVEEWFKTQVGEITQNGLFPKTREVDGQAWYGPKDFRSNHPLELGGPWYWAVSDTGEVREHTVGHNPPMNRCVQHLLEQAGFIFDRLSSAAVKKVYENLK